ncbi:hypothetical protein FHG87_004541 [Trinorchestia longiramus]|nr:hypothetical protein FHG87_004541 [Trinorchestia longiramus]
MQTPGGSSRPMRRCGRPKRFDDSDSDEPTLRSVSRKPAGIKRKVTSHDYDSETPPKRQRIITSKVLSFKSSFQPSDRDDINWGPARKRAAPKSVSEKWKQKHASAVKSTVYKGAGSADDEDDDEGEDEEEDDEDEDDDDDDDDLARDRNDSRGNQDEDEEDDEDEDEDDKAEMNADEELESMLSEYRQMFGKAVVDMSKGNAIANGSVESETEDSKKDASTKNSCENCNAQKEEMEHLEEMIKLKDCEMQQILHTINSARGGGQKLSTSLSENIEKRISYHKLYLETEKKMRNTVSEYYIQKDARLSKRKDFLDKKMAVYKDVGSRHQILRDATKYLNDNQLTFLSGQLSTEKNLTGKGNCLPPKYRELLLSIFQRSTIAYKVLKSFGFNFPPLLSMQQLAQSEAIRPNEGAYTMLNARSRPVPAHQRTLRAICSDEEDEEIADLLDAATVQHDQSIVTDEEAEDGVDGDYGDVQPEEIIEEEEEEGGADYLSDDDPTFPNKLKEVPAAEVVQQQQVAVEEEENESGAPQEESEQPDEVQQTDVTQQEATGDELQQEYRTDIQEQLDNQLSSHLTAEPQFETMEAGVISNRSLAEQVDVMEEVVRQVTDVEQLESIDPIQSDDQIQEQIEISDTTSTQDLSGPPATAIISAGTPSVPAVGANDIVVSECGEENVGQNVEVAVPDVDVASTVETSVAGEVVAENVEVTAETEVAERGADMPIL